MSKRGRITLDPHEATDLDEVPETEADSPNGFSSPSDTTPGTSAPVKRAPGVGTIVKLVFAGLAVATLFLLLKNRRP